MSANVRAGIARARRARTARVLLVGRRGRRAGERPGVRALARKTLPYL
jgi:hypothetical protein